MESSRVPGKIRRRWIETTENRREEERGDERKQDEAREGNLRAVLPWKG